jgi:hypothetical protein
MEAFPKPPKTRRQLAEEFLEHFQADVEKAETALGNARRKLREAIVLRDDAEENLRRALREPDDAADGGETSESTMQLTAPAEDAEGDEIDPITGEVQATAPPVVVAVYPGPNGGEEPTPTEVGPYTTYAELAADFCTWSGFAGELRELAILSEDDREPHKMRDVISPDDYGSRLLVVVLADSPDLVQCPTCDGDGRPYAKDGSRNGNAVCIQCSGYGCVARAANEPAV